MRERPIRVGIIGTGFGARVHLPAFFALPETDVIALCGLDAAKTVTIARVYGVPHAFTGYRELLAHPEVDAVSIATPPASHHAIAVAALAAGKHVLCEKPMARNANEAREMARMAESTGVTAMVAHEFRFLPARARMKELIDDGFLGPVSLAQVTFLQPLLAMSPSPAPPWMLETEAGGGIPAVLGAHYIDAVRWWLGEVQEVAGSTSAAPTERQAAAESCGILLRFAGGATGILTLSATAWHGPGEEVRVFGAEGMLAITPDGILWGARQTEPTPAPVPIPSELLGSGIPEVDAAPGDPLIPPFIRLARRWAEGIATGTSPSPSFADGLRVQEVVDAVTRSQQQHKWVDVSGARWPLAPSR